MQRYVIMSAANLRCLVQLDTVGRRSEAYRWRPCGVTPGMLFPNSRGNKAAANLRLSVGPPGRNRHFETDKRNITSLPGMTG